MVYVPLDQYQIVSIASAFIVQCPYELPKSFPKVTIDPTSGKSGDSFSVETSESVDNAYCLFLQGGVAPLSSKVEDKRCVVPEGVSGEIYIVLAASDDVKLLNSESTIAGPAAFNVTQ